MSEIVQDKALRIYYQVVAMELQMRSNGMDSSVWAKAVSLLEKEPSVMAAREREIRTREEKISYHKAQMRPEVLAQTEAMDRSRQLEAENAALKAKLSK